VFVVRTDAIENLALASHAVFDKTGTLTDAHLELAAVDAADRDAALALAAAIARGSRHPVAQALAGAASGLPVQARQSARSTVPASKRASPVAATARQPGLRHRPGRRRR
jgi:cation transport ATPase